MCQEEFVPLTSCFWIIVLQSWNGGRSCLLQYSSVGASKAEGAFCSAGVSRTREDEWRPVRVMSRGEWRVLAGLRSIKNRAEGSTRFG